MRWLLISAVIVIAGVLTAAILIADSIPYDTKERNTHPWMWVAGVVILGLSVIVAFGRRRR